MIRFPLSTALALALALLPAGARPQGGVPYAAPDFTPEAGFAGDSHGDGRLKLGFGRERAFHVESHGALEPDGVFRLDQTVAFEGEPATARTWRIRAAAPGRYAATLTDAAGPVTGETEGRVLRLDYRLKGPLYMHQQMVLKADGRAIDNQAEITLLGLPVGHLHEAITRQAPATVGAPSP